MTREGNDVETIKRFASQLRVPPMNMPDDMYSRRIMSFDVFEDAIYASYYPEDRVPICHLVDPVDFASALSGVRLSSPVLPRNCLAWETSAGAERIAIFVEPKVWNLRLSGNLKSSLDRSVDVPLPGFIFFGGFGTQYYLAAVTDDYPTGESDMYRMPLPNINGDYLLCQGNASFPPASADTIYQALDVLLSSQFNSHLSGGKHKGYNNINNFLYELSADGATVYPVDELVPIGRTFAHYWKEG